MQGAGVDSVVLQATTTDDGDLKTAQKIADSLGAKLEVLKCSPIRPDREQLKQWRNVTGRPLGKTVAFAGLLHHERGQSIPLIRYGNGRGIEIAFHGLQQYQKDHFELNDGSIQRKEILREFSEQWGEDVRLVRIDRCLDKERHWQNFTNSRDHRKLISRHGAGTYRGTTIYYRGKKPKYVQVLAYSKQHANGLDYPLNRIEFGFMAQYWKDLAGARVDDVLESAIAKSDSFIDRVFR